ncbi:unnamed protein product [Effrenium voratum]|uniref:Uncharacterized protein n=1 Tax=Effrenium voratum TaxID=2562239 RepID=A0AA36IPA3_9DINO|nr:unnamed protein product [Effrenium voratum]CAJ1457921.1 unnamed protein product [Effrenium voratum]
MVFQVAYGLPIVGCMFFYGVQFVPAKLRSTYNGAVFQWFMASGGLFTGLVVGVALVDDVPGGTAAGLIGGALVALSNTIILHLKRTLGLFTGVVLYQAANLATGYCVGRFGFLGVSPDAGRLPYLRDAGAVLLLVSLRLASISSQPAHRVRAMSVLSDPLLEVTEEDFHGCDPETISLVMSESENADDLLLHMHEIRSSAGQPGIQRAISDRLQRRRSGVSGASQMSITLEGLDEEVQSPARRRSWPEVKLDDRGLASEVTAPLSPQLPAQGHISRANTPGSRGGFYDVPEHSPVDLAGPLDSPFELASNVSAQQPKAGSMAVGWILALLAGVCRGMNPVPFAMWHRQHPSTKLACFVFPMALGVWASSTVIYLGYTSCKKVLHLRSPSKPNIRPAFLSGCLWALGFACFAQSLDDIGYTATWVLSTIGPVLVSQLVSVFYFKEIQERSQLRWFASACTAQFAGMACIILGT